ncbi:7,8-didemethyl-8-hydroxy-5-deazariboflavin synthase subunit CofH [Myxacorys almedinensis]|uniref:5-amino-6-(D-ribitylamino)uracil--L-tyrosine 4-hydroxyphenyl transferase n=1 Tax=Myxacorys almedinensis A TaxID=2690445 RepID=A0A8J7Z5F1_9CYAN|nr:7,8-didemethyl-8-hydroxy-5-deazariboflavin synthase subunit CofH [Myxacorys almedinensis]NDJ15825.1 7,8-didemethyl-8-hydroxy-5-deazariboflavin synthase subunit CofH [Myxacorys almedinensis A]
MIDEILERALAGEDIACEEGVALLRQTDPDSLEQIRVTADRLRQQQAGDTVTYVINRNINFTNICEQHCSFCAFRRDRGDEGAYWLDQAQILEKATDAVMRHATEICMQGGLNPEAKLHQSSLAFYVSLIHTIKSEFPHLHLHAFSPQEIQFIAREDQRTVVDTIAALRDAGVDSMPGTAAEVLDDEVRRILCPEKLDTKSWLDVVQTTHQQGIPTTSTLLSGHIETPDQQMQHLNLLRSLQQTAQQNGTCGITEFILLPFVGQDAPKSLRRRVGRDQPVLSDSLLLMAVARIFLGNWIPNHQPSWVKLGLPGALEALRWGCNDIGGTLMEEHITTMAGAIGGTCMEVETLQTAIASIGRPYAQRDTLYRQIAPQPALGSALPEAATAVAVFPAPG